MPHGGPGYIQRLPTRCLGMPLLLAIHAIFSLRCGSASNWRTGGQASVLRFSYRPFKGEREYGNCERSECCEAKPLVELPDHLAMAFLCRTVLHSVCALAGNDGIDLSFQASNGGLAGSAI